MNRVRVAAQGRHGRAAQRVLPVLEFVRLGVDPWAVLIAERRSAVAVGVIVSVVLVPPPPPAAAAVRLQGCRSSSVDASTVASTEDVTDRSSPEES